MCRQSRPGLTVEPLFEERLILASTDPAAPPTPGDGYVHIDWGPEFFARHSVSFPDFPGPGLTANIGWLGLQYILENGGTGYFPLRLIRPYLGGGRLTAVKGAPEFALPAYVVYPTGAAPDPFDAALGTMRALAASEVSWAAAG